MNNPGELWSFLNSGFISSCAGAFAGACSAYFITARGKKREELAQDFRNINTMIILSWDICNSFLAMKDQHIANMKKVFEKQCEDYERRYASYLDGSDESNQVMDINLNLQSLENLNVPIGSIQDLVSKTTTMYGKVTSLTWSLKRSIDTANRSISNRNEILEEFRGLKLDSQDLCNAYFGLVQESGKSDERYASSVKIISESVDDVIVFSMNLCNELNKMGMTVRNQLHGRRLRVNKPEFQAAYDKGLVPSSERYTKWSQAFKHHKEERKSITRRVIDYLQD